MLDGSFDPATAVYENRARLFMVRLLDTTQVAIDVGASAWAPTNGPGPSTWRVTGAGFACPSRIRPDVAWSGPTWSWPTIPRAYMPEVAKAAATAGIPFRALPRGTEYVYPAVARIGQGPVVSWQWRSDVVPRLQPVVPGTVVFDSSSEEGRMLLTWGFTPKVLGYIPNVRGVITAWRISQAHAACGTNARTSRLLRAATSRRVPGGVIGQLPVLRLVAQEISPGLHAPVRRRHMESAQVARAVTVWSATSLGLEYDLPGFIDGDAPQGGGRRDAGWSSNQLARHEGSFVGPGVEATILPGAADWTRIRKDGVGIVNVQASFGNADR